MQNDWEPAQPPPGAELAPPQVAEDPPAPFVDTGAQQVLPVETRIPATLAAETLPPGPPSGLSLVLETVGTYIRLFAPAFFVAIVIGILLPLFFFFLLFGSDQAFMPLENLLTILVFGAIYSLFLTGAVMTLRVFAGARGLGDLVTWGVPVVIALVGAPIAWLVSGDDWIGTTAGRMGTHAALAGIGLALDLSVKGTRWVAQKADRALRRRFGGALLAGWPGRFGRRAARAPAGIDVPPEVAGKAMSAAFLARTQREASAAEPWAGGPYTGGSSPN